MSSENSEDTNQDSVKETAILLFEHIEGQIGRVDLKAQLILAADAILVATVTTIDKDIAGTLLNPVASLLPKMEAACSVGLFLTLLLSFLFALAVVKPNLRAPSKPTLVYFGQIARYKQVGDFVQQFMSQTPLDIESALLTEVYTKSRIAAKKYNLINLSVLFLFIALFLWAASEIIREIAY